MEPPIWVALGRILVGTVGAHNQKFCRSEDLPAASHIKVAAL
jgi:hypothetical protein